MEKTEPLTTKTLDVAGVDVVEQKPAKAPFIGPFYGDELDALREMLRRMPKRDEHIVFESGSTWWIYKR